MPKYRSHTSYDVKSILYNIHQFRYQRMFGTVILKIAISIKLYTDNTPISSNGLLQSTELDRLFYVSTQFVNFWAPRKISKRAFLLIYSVIHIIIFNILGIICKQIKRNSNNNALFSVGQQYIDPIE